MPSSRITAVACIALGIACGTPRPNDRPPPTAPTPAPSADAATEPAPNATTTFNLSAFRSSARTARLVDVLRPLLPENDATDVEWLTLAGPAPLVSSPRNVVFVKKRGAELRMVRGPESSGAPVPAAPSSNELVRIDVRAPKENVRVPHLHPSEAVESLTFSATARDDGGAELRLHERCTDEAEAKKAAAALDVTVERWNEKGVGMITGGLFADVKATTEGREARLDVVASPTQVDAIVDFALMLARGP